MEQDDLKLNLSFELKEDNLFKIYNDGSNYVGTLVQPTQPKKHHVIVRTDNTRFNKAYIKGKQQGFNKKRFGRNDFQYIDEAILRCTNTIYYIVKYISKSDERIVYSRNLPSEIYRTLKEDDIVCEFINCMYKVILFDNVIVDERYNHYKFSHMNS